MTDIKLSYGVILEEDTVYEILPKLLATMSLFEQKAIYAGLTYEPLSDEDKAEVDAVDSDDPEFMVTDFGQMEIMDIFRDYVHDNYGPLYCMPFQDVERVAVCLTRATQWVQFYGEFSPEKFNDIPAEEKAEMDRFIEDMGLSSKPQPIIWTQDY